MLDATGQAVVDISETRAPWGNCKSRNSHSASDYLIALPYDGKEIPNHAVDQRVFGPSRKVDKLGIHSVGSEAYTWGTNKDWPSLKGDIHL